MKKISLLLLLSLFSMNLLAQDVFSLNEVEGREALRLNEDDYTCITGKNAIDAIFYKTDDIANFYNLWSDYFNDMGEYFSKETELVFDEKIFFKVFCNSKGEAEFIFYKTEEGTKIKGEDTIKDFEKALKKFGKKHRINIRTTKKFEQCGNVWLNLKNVEVEKE